MLFSVPAKTNPVKKSGKHVHHAHSNEIDKEEISEKSQSVSTHDLYTCCNLFTLFFTVTELINKNDLSYQERNNIWFEHFELLQKLMHANHVSLRVYLIKVSAAFHNGFI